MSVAQVDGMTVRFEKTEHGVRIFVESEEFRNSYWHTIVSKCDWLNHFNDPNADYRERMLVAMIMSQSDWDETVAVDEAECVVELFIPHKQEWLSTKFRSDWLDEQADNFIHLLQGWVRVIYRPDRVHVPCNSDPMIGYH